MSTIAPLPDRLKAALSDRYRIERELGGRTRDRRARGVLGVREVDRVGPFRADPEGAAMLHQLGF